MCLGIIPAVQSYFPRDETEMRKIAAFILVGLGALLCALLWWYASVILSRTRWGVFETPISPFSLVYFYFCAVLAIGVTLAIHWLDEVGLRKFPKYLMIAIGLPLLAFSLLHALGKIHHMPLLEWLNMELERDYGDVVDGARSRHRNVP
jgi:hypothetical protein